VWRKVTAGRKRHQHQAKRSLLYESASSPVPLRQELTVDYELILRQVMDENLAFDRSVHRRHECSVKDGAVAPVSVMNARVNCLSITGNALANELSSLAGDAIPVVMRFHGRASRRPQPRAKRRISKNTSDRSRCRSNVGWIHHETGLAVANGRTYSTRITTDNRDSARASLDERNSESFYVDLVVETRKPDVNGGRRVRVCEFLVVQLACEVNPVGHTQRFRERAQPRFVVAGSHYHVVQRRKFRLQRCECLDRDVLSLVRNEPRHRQHDRGVTQLQLRAQAAGLTRWRKAHRIRPEIDRCDGRRTGDSNFAHDVARERRGPFRIGDDASGVTQQAVRTYALAPVRRSLASLAQQISAVHVYHIRHRRPLVRPPDCVAD